MADLQRSAGNRAVSALVRSADGQAPLRLQRFEEREHKPMGDVGAAGATVTLPGGLHLSFGDITAMAGDYFGSVAQLRSLAAKPGNGKTPGTRDEIEFVLHVKVRRDKEAEDFGPEVAVAVDKRMYTLTGTNVTHFTERRPSDVGLGLDELAKARGPVPDEAAWAYGVPKGTKMPVTNAGSYRANHEEALKAATRAGAGGSSTMDDALLFEAFASHFLTDAYSAGHVRTPRAGIGEWWDPKIPMFWTNFKLWMAEVIAKHIDHHSVAGVLTVQILYELTQATLRDLSASLPALTFGDVISGALHDQDNETGIAATVGTEVTKLVGDGEVIDEQGRARAAGVATAQKATAGVRASLTEVQDAFAFGAKGLAPEAAIAEIRLPDGLFRAEQLWPRALADTDSRQSNPSWGWQAADTEALFANARIRAALARFFHRKAETYGSQVKLEWPFGEAKQEAFKETVLDRFTGGEASVIEVLRTVINYTPGSATGKTGGVFGLDQDDDAVGYYQAAKDKGALETLTLIQRTRLVRLGLEGTTTGNEDVMISELLTSHPAQANEVLKDVGWRWVWSDLSGDELQRVVDQLGPAFWATQPLAAKKSEIAYLTAGPTQDHAQRTILVILRTCANSAEVREIDASIGGLGLDFDLTGRYQEEFDRLKE